MKKDIDWNQVAKDLEYKKKYGEEAFKKMFYERHGWQLPPEDAEKQAVADANQTVEDTAETRDPKLQRKFENWIDLANTAASGEGVFLTEVDEETILSLSRRDDRDGFLKLLTALEKRGERAKRNETNQEVPKDLGFGIREEWVHMARELFFSRDLLSGNHIAIRLTRAYIQETVHKHFDVGLAMVLWGAIFAGAIVWMGSPWWTGVIFASMVCFIIFVYLSTSRIRQIRNGAALALTPSGGSGLLDDSDFIQSIGINTERTIKLNKVIEVIWGLGFLGLIPLMWLFFGVFMAIVLSCVSLLIAFLFLVFTWKTTPLLFERAVKQEKADRQSVIDKFKAKSDVG